MSPTSRLPAILVMAEYSVGDSPLWWRGPSSAIGMAFAPDLGLSGILRSELESWNDVYDGISATGYEFPSDAVEAEHRVRAFELASVVQTELGDGVEVWCGGGEGVDSFPHAHGGQPWVIVDSSPHDSELVVRAGDRLTRKLAEDLGVTRKTALFLAHWRSSTRVAGVPEGTARTRADGLTVTASIQSELGLSRRAVFFGGAAGPG